MTTSGETTDPRDPADACPATEAGSATMTRELRSAPRVLPLYARAAASMLPGSSRLPFLAGGGGAMPELKLGLSGVRVDPDRLAAYARVCGFSLRDELPATYPHVLAFPLHLALMSDGRFPYRAIGLVHIANAIIQYRPLRLGEPLDLRVHVTQPEPHARGSAFALVSEARVGDELVWEDRSTMLRRGGASAKPDRATGAEKDDASSAAESSSREHAAGAPTSERDGQDAPPPPGNLWRLPGDLGRRYASVSGDSNPIHLHALTAKPLGFPRAIAHGMWTKARCLAALEQLLPPAFEVQVGFRRPIQLPATVAFADTRASGEPGSVESIDFSVADARRGTPHLEGRLRLSPGASGTSGSAAGSAVVAAVGRSRNENNREEKS